MRALLVLAWLLAATGAEAALPRAPFALSASPTTLVEGAPIEVRVTPVPSETSGEGFDLYVVLASVAQAAFLTPDGGWVAQPTPYAQRRTTGDGPLQRRWSKAWPSGRHALGLVVVPVGADPLARADWRFQPSIAWIDVTPAAPATTPPDRTTLALLVLALGGAIALVWWAGHDRRRAAVDLPRPRQPTARGGGR
jgi:hypothetical protein